MHDSMAATSLAGASSRIPPMQYGAGSQSVRATVEALLHAAERFYARERDIFVESKFLNRFAKGIAELEAVEGTETLRTALTGLRGFMATLMANDFRAHFARVHRALPAYREGIMTAVAALEQNPAGRVPLDFSLLNLNEQQIPNWMERDNRSICSRWDRAWLTSKISTANGAIYHLRAALEGESEISPEIHEKLLSKAVCEVAGLYPDKDLRNPVYELKRSVLRLLMDNAIPISLAERVRLDDRLAQADGLLRRIAERYGSVAHRIAHYDDVSALVPQSFSAFMRIQESRVACEEGTKGLRTVYPAEELQRLKALPGSHFFELRQIEEVLGLGAALGEPETMPSCARQILATHGRRLGRAMYLVLLADSPDAYARLRENPNRIMFSAFKDIALTQHFDSLFGWVRADNDALLSHVAAGANILTEPMRIEEDGHVFEGIFLHIPLKGQLGLEDFRRPVQKRRARAIHRQAQDAFFTSLARS